LNPDGNLTIRDTWSTGTTGVNVTWKWLTLATAFKTGDGFVLKQSDKTLQLKAKSDLKLSFEVEDASSPQNRFDSPNPGLSRLRIRLETPANSNRWMEVTATADTYAD
jgi:oligo-alginate lyase